MKYISFNRFKFRYWDKSLEKMMYGYIPPTAFSDDSEYILMQSTGMVDTNHALIYECDILWVNGIIGYRQLIWEGAAWKHIPIADKYIRPNDYIGLTNDFFYINQSDIEILGNIYENPDLLES